MGMIVGSLYDGMMSHMTCSGSYSQQARPTEVSSKRSMDGRGLLIGSSSKESARLVFAHTAYRSRRSALGRESKPRSVLLKASCASPQIFWVHLKHIEVTGSCQSSGEFCGSHKISDLLALFLISRPCKA